MTGAAIFSLFDGLHGQIAGRIGRTFFFLENRGMTVRTLIPRRQVFTVLEDHVGHFFGVLENNVSAILFRPGRGIPPKKNRRCDDDPNPNTAMK